MLFEATRPSVPGIILADIEQSIREAHVIVADITPRNANVYYEVGYSHALGKPTILVAEKETELPFDVSPFRRALPLLQQLSRKSVVRTPRENFLPK